MKLTFGKILCAGLASTFIVACGPVLESVGLESDDEKAAVADAELLSLDVNVEEEAQGFALAAASKFNISLGGCASGYTAEANETKVALNVYRFDRGCLAKLTSLEYGGIVYLPSAGIPFTTWLPGDSAIFTDGGSNSIRVIVSAQLSNPVVAADTVAYSFTEIVQGSGQVFEKNVVGSGKTMSVDGQAAPAFQVKSLSFAGITSAGAGEFSFTFECTQALTGSGVDSICKDLKLSQLKYILVKDTFDGTLNSTQAAALFASGGSSITLSEVLAAGSGGTANGGFASQTLAGPEQMHLNPNMILVIEGAAASYLYFNVDVSTLSQSDTL